MSQVTVHNNKPDSIPEYCRKLWKFRGLILSFAIRDIKAKYAQTYLGAVWALIQPTIMVGLYSIFFGYILNWKTGGIPFPLYVFSGLIGWNLFQSIVISGSNSVQESSILIRKIYFPKFILILSKVISSLFDMAVSLILFFVLMVIFHQPVSYRLLLIPMLLPLYIICSLTIVTWVSVLSRIRKDVIQVLPFIVNIWLWTTPVFFTKSILPEHLQFIWQLNPLTGLIDAWRWCTFTAWDWDIQYFISTLLFIPLFLLGFWFYLKYESTFSDYS